MYLKHTHCVCSELQRTILYTGRKPVQQGIRDVSQDPQFSPAAGRNRNLRDNPGWNLQNSSQLYLVHPLTHAPGRGHMWTHKPAPFYSDCNTRLSFSNMPFCPKGSLLHLNRLLKTHATQFLNAGYPDLSENGPYWFIYL